VGGGDVIRSRWATLWGQQNVIVRRYLAGVEGTEGRMCHP